MKKERVTHLIVLLSAVLIVSISLPNTAKAGDSGSFAVSCTMPAIPGLNVPIIEEETVKTDTSKATTTTQEKDINIQKEIQEQPPIMMIQQDREKEIRLVTGQSPPLIVKTLYVR